MVPFGWVKMFCLFLESKESEGGEFISGGLILFPPIQWIRFILCSRCWKDLNFTWQYLPGSMCCWLCDLFKHDSHVIIPEAEPMGCLPSTLNFYLCLPGWKCISIKIYGMFSSLILCGFWLLCGCARTLGSMVSNGLSPSYKWVYWGYKPLIFTI